MAQSAKCKTSAVGRKNRFAAPRARATSKMAAPYQGPKAQGAMFAKAKLRFGWSQEIGLVSPRSRPEVIRSAQAKAIIR